MNQNNQVKTNPKKVVDKDTALDYDVETVKDNESKAIEEKYEKILKDEERMRNLLDKWAPLLERPEMDDMEWFETDEEKP